MSVTALQTAAFFREVARKREVWSIEDGAGFPAPMSAEGVRAMPVWSTEARARRVTEQVPSYRGFRPVRISLREFLDVWLPLLEDRGEHVGINWRGPRATGWDWPPQSVRTRLAVGQRRLDQSNS